MESVEGMDRNRYSSIRFLAPLKLVSLSEWISAGSPRLAIKCFRQAKNASVVRSEMISKCTVFCREADE